MLPWQWLPAAWVYKMLLWFLLHASIVSTHSTHTHGVVHVTDNTKQCKVCVLLTKLHHSSFCYLWSIIIWLAKPMLGTSTESSRMNSTWTHPAGCESVSTTCLSTFRKSELGRKERTDQWIQVQNHANAVSIQQ